MNVKIWFISDTHGCHFQLKVPDNIDIVIHGGDCSNYRDLARNANEVNDFMDWFSRLYIPRKIYVPGNHDTSIEAGMITIPDNVNMLVNQEIVVEGIKVYGSPNTPEFGNGWAYNIKRRSDMMKHCWENIPMDTDILVTHGPPHKVLDYVGRAGYGEHTGCEVLAMRIGKIPNLRIHIFGHIHEHPGTIHQKRYGHLMYINAAVLYYGLTSIMNHGVIVEYEVI